MEKKTYDLCLKVLKIFNKADLLKHIILIGSWSIYFYKNYFNSESYSTFIRTRDIDFLIPFPFRLNKDIEVFKLIENLGFVVGHKGIKGYIELKHPDLTIEFLVPERGRGTDEPYKIPRLGINALSLRYLDFLASNTIVIKFDDLRIRLPHPAAYALHKFIIFKRRSKIDKHDRDIEGALRVFRELIKSNEHIAIKHVFAKMHSKWQKTVIKNLESIEEDEIIDILKSK